MLTRFLLRKFWLTTYFLWEQRSESEQAHEGLHFFPWGRLVTGLNLWRATAILVGSSLLRPVGVNSFQQNDGSHVTGGSANVVFLDGWSKYLFYLISIISALVRSAIQAPILLMTDIIKVIAGVSIYLHLQDLFECFKKYSVYFSQIFFKNREDGFKPVEPDSKVL